MRSELNRPPLRLAIMGFIDITRSHGAMRNQLPALKESYKVDVVGWEASGRKLRWQRVFQGGPSEGFGCWAHWGLVGEGLKSAGELKRTDGCVNCKP